MKPPVITKINSSSIAGRLVTHLLVFGEARLVVDVGRHQVELVLLSQQPQQDDHRAAAALPHTVVHHLAGEGDHLHTHRKEKWIRQ